MIYELVICNLNENYILSTALGVRSSPAAFPMPKWNPPAMVSKCSTASPSNALSALKIDSTSPGIRVGLSRNIKVKPLHPNVKLTN